MEAGISGLPHSDSAPIAQKEAGAEVLKDLYRIDQRTWSYRIPTDKRGSFSEIRFEVPAKSKVSADQFVLSIAQKLSETTSEISERDLHEGFCVSLRSSKGSLEKWNFSSRVSKRSRWNLFSLIRRALNCFPIFHKFKEKNVISLSPKKITTTTASEIELQPTLPNIPLSESYHVETQERLSIAAKSFDDPFTRLSSTAFKTVEEFFVLETVHRGSYRFKLEEGLLSLAKIRPDDPKHNDENRPAVEAFRTFLLKEYGQNFVDRLENEYLLSLQDMIRDGLPLFPDHVSKANVVMNNIEIPDVERLFEALSKLLPSIKKAPPETSASEWLSQLSYGEKSSLLSLREARGLLKSLPNDTVSDLIARIEGICGDEKFVSARELPAARFNQLVECIMPSDDERKLSFAGREIQHAAVASHYTMGTKNISNPFRDFFELQHIFLDCRKKDDWNNYYELLSFIVAKKSLFRSDPSRHDWRAGLLIPAPDSPSNEKRWYYNDSFIDDGQGNVNYTFFPATKHYLNDFGQTLPLIKLYRSTNHHRNAINWQDSIVADLNPFSAPGSLDPKRASEFECEFFDNRTIPIWVAYLLACDGEPSPTREEYLTKSADLFQKYDVRGKLKPEDAQDARLICQQIQTLALEKNYTLLEKKLTQLCKKFQERPEDKIAQNCVFVGHSLGGVLAQFGTAYFSTNRDRVPFPGHTFTCISFDGPATANATNKQFMNFGRQHSDVLFKLGIKWNIYHQFEYADFVPQAGGSHLGSTKRKMEEDSKWLEVSTQVMRPLNNATALPITTLPTHGRRFCSAQKGADFTATELTSQQLYKFDHSLWLTRSLEKTFGNSICRSPVLSEIFRRVVGLFSWNMLIRMRKRIGNKIGFRWGGVFAIHEGHDAAIKAITQKFYDIKKIIR